MLECKTFRMRGHEEASGTKYVPKKLMDNWSKKDPLINFEEYLLNKKILNKDAISSIRLNISNEINKALEITFDEDAVKSNNSFELDCL